MYKHKNEHETHTGNKQHNNTQQIQATHNKHIKHNTYMQNDKKHNTHILKQNALTETSKPKTEQTNNTNKHTQHTTHNINTIIITKIKNNEHDILLTNTTRNKEHDTYNNQDKTCKQTSEMKNTIKSNTVMNT